ncbi:MAG: hypothetical protein GF331_06580, partial [Chitinivibrionales bacterium]|nr:hypothetical protein [Chitinivibrionales bacterium]
MTDATVRIALLWDSGPVHGRIQVTGGQCPTRDVSIDRGQPARVELTVSHCRLDPGANATMVQLDIEKSPVSFFVRDITADTPVFIPAYGLAITAASDPRDYRQIAADIERQGLVSSLHQIDRDSEEDYTGAARHNRDMRCPTWLGVARDMRLFRLSLEEPHGYWGYVQPAHHSFPCRQPETDDREYALHFVIGAGASCRPAITRRLDDGTLPIVRSEQREGDVVYFLTAFGTLETQRLSPEAVRGSAWQAAYAFTMGSMYSTQDKERLRETIEHETHGREEETVCCVRIVAENHGRVPRYAWFKAARMSRTDKNAFDGKTGFAEIGPDRICAVHRIDGSPMPQEEMAVLLQPGQRLTFDLLIPHQPLNAQRAHRLAALDVDAHLSACRAFWQNKLASVARMTVPEADIDKRIQAGLLHLDLNSIGREPDDAVMACVGWYSPIGSESAPMIQFYDCMGWHPLAERCLDFFFERQRDDGFMQNFGGYQLETGAVLWTAGEHFRYTRDTAWARRVEDKLLKACDFLIAWRDRNKREQLRGRGYGLLDGKVADPEDFYHAFMLNGLTYIGLQRAAELLTDVNIAQSDRLAREAAALRTDIRTAYHESLARAPVVPLGDGTWAPAPPPWPEYRGPLALYAEGGSWFTHGAFGA